MRRCSRCVMPDTRPDTEFVDGVCSACLAHERRKEIDWEPRMKALEQIVKTLRPNSMGYDCIVPSSGGKDSHYQVQRMLELGAHPLVVTATTCHLTEIGRENIDNLARHATTIEVSPNKETRAKLNRLGLELVGDISWPEHSSIFTTPFRLAWALGIDLIVYGENPQREYGGPISTQEACTMTRRWISEFGGFLGLRPDDLISAGIPEQHLNDYRLPPNLGDITAIFLGQYEPWDSRRNWKVAESMGMKAERSYGGAWWEFENLDNAQTGCHDRFGYLKYGYGRASAQISVDIRNKLISRDEGLIIAAKADAIFPTVYCGVPFTQILEQIGMTMEEYTKIEDRFNAHVG